MTIKKTPRFGSMSQLFCTFAFVLCRNSKSIFEILIKNEKSVIFKSMKKVFIISMMLFAVMGISAQSIVGKWKSENIKQDGFDGVVTFTFAKGTAFDMLMALHMEQDDMKVDAHLTIPGTYNLVGDQLTVNLDREKLVFKLDDLSFSGKAAEKIKENPQMEGMVRNIMEQALEANKEKIVDAFPVTGTNTVNITATQLVIDNLVFNKVIE